MLTEFKQNRLLTIGEVEIPECETATSETVEELTCGKGEDDGYEQ